MNYVAIKTNDGILCHYGVLGMKWGVRRTPEQLGRHTIPKGTIMYRSTVNKDESTSGHKYVTYLPPDRDLYRGTYASKLKTNSGKNNNDPLYENQYSLKTDLNMPSRKEIKEIIRRMRETDKHNQMAIENGKAFCKNFLGYNTWDAFEMAMGWYEGKYNKPMSTEEDYKKALDGVHAEVVSNYVKRYKDMPIDELFIDTVRSFGTSDMNRNRVIKELKKRGYNAMVDEAGVGSNKTGREGVEPIIIFDGDSSLDKISTTKVSKRTQAKATKNNTKWHRTANWHRSDQNPW